MRTLWWCAALAACADAPKASGPDADGDGSSVLVDCDDENAAIHPDAGETCDAVDNDCDGRIDDADSDLTGATTWYRDLDQDGAGATNDDVVACEQPDLYVAVSGDCDDTMALLSPLALEVCDRVDNDCDVLVDEADPDLDPALLTTSHADADGDGVGNDLTTVVSCFAPPGNVPSAGDCDDTDPEVQGPVGWHTDVDGDGFGAGDVLPATCVDPGDPWIPDGDIDCDDADPLTWPGAPDECGDGIDHDCNSAGAVCSEIVVGVLPNDAGKDFPYLGWNDLEANALAYGTCPLRTVDIVQPFALPDLLASGATVLWSGNPAGGSVQYSPTELAAIRDFTLLGHGGFVGAFLLRYNAVDNSDLLTLGGVNPGFSVPGYVVAQTRVDVLEPSHPMMHGIQPTFQYASYPNTQEMSVAWPAALTFGARIVAESNDGLQVVVAYEDKGVRGAYTSGLPEFSPVSPDEFQLLYNTACWVSGY